MGKKVLIIVAILISLGIIVVALNLASIMLHKTCVEKAYAKLRIGMTKNEIDGLFKGCKFIMKQTVVLYPNSSEQEMRRTFSDNEVYEDLYPKDLIERVTFTGNIKVFSYLIRERMTFANPVIVYYAAIFYDESNDRVIGWARMSKSGDIGTWNEKF
jgi:hypothetical protein